MDGTMCISAEDTLIIQLTKIENDIHVVARRLERCQEMIGPEELDLIRIAVTSIHSRLQMNLYDYARAVKERKVK